METGISKGWLLVEHDRPVLRYGGLLMCFPLCSLLSAHHSFLTAHDDCLALLSRYQELSVCFRRRAKQDACSDVPMLGSVHDLLGVQQLHWGVQAESCMSTDLARSVANSVAWTKQAVAVRSYSFLGEVSLASFMSCTSHLFLSLFGSYTAIVSIGI